MGLAFSRSCVLAVVVVASAIVSAPAFADSTIPSGLTATAVSDRTVELTWSWGSSPSYPDEVDVYRDGALDSSISPVASTSFLDTVPSAHSTHTYQLVTVTGGTPSAPTPSTPVSVTTRTDLPAQPTNVQASFGPTNIATVTWQRSPADSDITYRATGTPVGGGAGITRTVRYAIGDASGGSLTLDGFVSYTQYSFVVSAIEDTNDPPGDAGGTVNGDAPALATSLDVLPPQFNGGTVTATRSSLGTITATWSAATDAGTGVTGYQVCVDVANCTTIPLQAGATQTADLGAGGIRNDGLSHSVSVVAVDGAGNPSTAITTSLVMPVLSIPRISLSAGDGCAPLVAQVSSDDPPTPGLTFHLYVDGSTTESPIGQVIGGDPYQQRSLVATASYGADTSAASAALLARVGDPDGPDVVPVPHLFADQSTNTETMSWDPVSEPAGAPITGYLVTTAIPGYENGFFVDQKVAPSAKIPVPEQSQHYSVTVAAVDACNRQGPSVSKLFELNDTIPPSAPVLNPPATGPHDVQLSWTPSTDNVAVDDYKIYQNGSWTGIRTTASSFDVTGLPEAQTFQWTVIATDTAGLQSAPSNVRSATTKDITSPTFPLGSVVTPTVVQGTITLKWPAASDNVGVSGYQVLRAGAAMQIVSGTTTTYTDREVPAGPVHYEVRAFDAAGNGSRSLAVDTTSALTPSVAVASAVKVVKTKGVKMMSVGGRAGSRAVLSFKLAQPFTRGVLKLNVLKAKATGKAVTKVRIFLAAGTGRTAPGKRLGEHTAKKGSISIPLGKLPKGPLKLVVTASAGSVTLAGTGAGKKAPMIVPATG
jgi:hypothetical protein